MWVVVVGGGEGGAGLCFCRDRLVLFDVTVFLV